MNSALLVFPNFLGLTPQNHSFPLFFPEPPTPNPPIDLLLLLKTSSTSPSIAIFSSFSYYVLLVYIDVEKRRNISVLIRKNLSFCISLSLLFAPFLLSCLSSSSQERKSSGESDQRPPNTSAHLSQRSAGRLVDEQGLAGWLTAISYYSSD